MIWVLIAIIGLCGFAGLVGSFIHFGHPIKETPVVRHEAVIVCLVPRVDRRV